MFESTLCYLEKDEKYLMLYRNKKEKDANKGKWIGVGGGIEEGETPMECIIREVWEETGLTVKAPKYRGRILFCSDIYPDEVMHLFTSTEFEGEIIECNEGTLEWIDKKEVPKLNLWEGDRVFLQYLSEDRPFFNLKLDYKGERLVGHTVEFDSQE